MKKLLLLCIPILLGLTACNKLSVEQAESAVLEGERGRIPLLVQQLSDVESIVIDSIRITIVDEPMEGYLYTTWKYSVSKEEWSNHHYREVKEQREKPVIVKVSNIHQSKERKGYIEWETDWRAAYMVILNDKY